MTPRVLCTLTVYNAAEYLTQAIQSVLDQTYEDWQLVILDDGSSDPLVPQLCLEACFDSRVTYERFDTTVAQRKASCRYAALINFAVNNFDAPLISHLAGDDFWHDDRLERMVAKFDQGHDVVYGPQVMINEDGSQLGVRPAFGVLRDAFHRVDYNSVLYSREAFVRVGGWPTAKGMWRDADAHFFKRLTDAGYVFVPIDGSEPGDTKRYRDESVDARVIRGEAPWA